jgi:hypothetical protein
VLELGRRGRQPAINHLSDGTGIATTWAKDFGININMLKYKFFTEYNIFCERGKN